MTISRGNVQSILSIWTLKLVQISSSFSKNPDKLWISVFSSPSHSSVSSVIFSINVSTFADQIFNYWKRLGTQSFHQNSQLIFSISLIEISSSINKKSHHLKISFASSVGERRRRK